MHVPKCKMCMVLAVLDSRTQGESGLQSSVAVPNTNHPCPYIRMCSMTAQPRTLTAPGPVIITHAQISGAQVICNPRKLKESLAFILCAKIAAFPFHTFGIYSFISNHIPCPHLVQSLSHELDCKNEQVLCVPRRPNTVALRTINPSSHCPGVAQKEGNTIAGQHKTCTGYEG